MQQPPTENLRREIGLRQFTLAILNGIIGSGIFALPGIMYEKLDGASIIAYVACGLCIFLIALCFAEVGSKVTVSGGTYTFIETAFGPFAGFIANNLFWFGSCVVSDAALANALADAMKYFFPFMDSGFSRILFFLLIFTSLAWINIRSVKHGAGFIVLIALAKVVPLIVLIVAGAGFISASNLRWQTIPSIGDISSTSLLLFFAFLGVETPITNGGEIKNPRRTVPAGIFFGITIVLIIYVSIQLVTQGILGASILNHKDAPLAAVAGIIFGTIGITVISMTAAISMLGTLAGEILSIPRILFAGARDGIMPKPLAKIHPRFFTPHIAIAIYSGLGFLLASVGAFRQLAVLASAATLLIYLGVVLSTIKLRSSYSSEQKESFRIPGGIIIPAIAVIVIVWLLTGLAKNELKAIGIFIGLLCLIYIVVIVAKKSGMK